MLDSCCTARWRFWTLSFLTLLSGATSLGYQVVWFKQFSHVWGNSPAAASTVVAAFLGGLAVGAAVFGRIATRLRFRVRSYGFCELGVGICGLLIPLVLPLVQSAFAAISDPLAAGPLISLLYRLVLTVIVLLPPCFLMGGTLPLLVASNIVASPGRDGGSGWIYGINTVGGAIGCFAAGFFLLPQFGIAGANWLFVALNVFIALTAMIVGRTSSERVPAAHNAAGASSLSTPSAVHPVQVQLAAALAGCAALMFEMLWARQLALILGGSTYAFSAMLSILLLGIGTGSVLSARFQKFFFRGSWPAVLVILALCGFALLGKSQIVALTEVVGSLRDQRGSLPFNALLCLAAAAVLQFLPAMAMGALFPVLVSLWNTGRVAASRAVGNIYCWNTLGAIVGATVIHTLVVPRWGSAQAFAITICLYSVAALLLVSFRQSQSLGSLVTAIVFAAMVLAASHPDDPLVTNRGMYLYGYQSVAQKQNTARALYFREGASCNVLVTEHPAGRSLYVNGKVDAGDSGDMPTQLALAYFPRLLRPEATDVLIIGFGSGTTSGASLLAPQAHVRCCEIEPAVFSASQFFHHVNHRPENTPRFSLISDDGRSYLQRTRQDFDLVISEPSNPWIAGIANLFTREHYRVVRSRLRPGGLFCQWIPLYQLSIDDCVSIVRTVAGEFGHVGIVVVSGGDVLMLASDQPLVSGPDVLTAAQDVIAASPEIQTDLTKHFGTSDARQLVLGRLLLDDHDVERLCREHPGGSVQTDRAMRLEFEAAAKVFAARGRDANIRHLLACIDSESLARRYAEWSAGVDDVAAIKHVCALMAQSGMIDERRGVCAALAAFAPDDPQLLSERIAAGIPDEAILADCVQRLTAASPTEAARAGERARQAGQHASAIAVFESLTSTQPQSPTLWMQLGAAYAGAGRRADAQVAFDNAASRDPFSPARRESERLRETQSTEDSTVHVSALDND